MGEFYTALSVDEMSRQVSSLINQYNRWYVKHTPLAIKHSLTDYFVEIEGSRVVGCAGLLKEFETLSKIMHVCVIPERRCCGIAKQLVNLAVSMCETQHVYMTVRDDNTPSLRMAMSLGFQTLGRKWSRDHYIITMGRELSHV
ncbi:hypothetical protein DRN34_00035 [Thermococci archaeon]|nr:MAG: hypothetical protein DRN34_00035 [Thermococci archaeon]